MNLLDLAVKISCKDEASGEVGGIANGIVGTMSKAAGVVSAVMGSAAVAGAVAIGKSALDAYASYEQLVGGVDTLFKESSGTIQAYAAEAYKTAGVSANTYMEQATNFSASLIQSLGGDTAKAAEYANLAIKDMSDNANKMGTSIESIQDTYQSLMRGNYAMLDNLKLGYGGTKTELERLVADAEKLTGEALDPAKFSDVITAIHAVQDSLGITGTTALEAATTIEGSVNSMKAAWDNWLAGLGNENADLDALTAQLVNSVEVAAGNIVPRIGKILDSAAQVVVQKAPSIVAGLGDALLSLLPGTLSASFSSAMQLWDMGGTIQEKINLVFGYLANALGEAAPGLSEQLSTFGEVFGSVAQLVQDNLGPAMDLAKQLMDGFGQVLSNVGSTVSAVLVPAIEQLSPVFTAFLEALQPWVEPLTNVATIIGNILVSAVTLLIEVLNSVIQIVTGVLNAIMNFQNFLNGVPATVSSVVSSIASFFGQLPGAIGGFLASVISSIASWVTDMVNKAVECGSEFLSSVQSGFQSVVNFFTELPGNILGALGDLGSLLWDAGSSIIDGLLSGMKSAADGLFGWVGGIAGTIASLKGPLPYDRKLLIPNGTAIMDSLYDGMVKGWPRVEGLLGDMTSEIGGFDFNLGTAKGVTRVVERRVENTYNFYDAVKSPAETARAIRMQQTYGLAGAR